MRKVVCTNDAPGVGHYSQAVKGGGFIFVSGQLALDPICPYSGIDSVVLTAPGTPVTPETMKQMNREGFGTF